jgi:hypothetical protein
LISANRNAPISANNCFVQVKTTFYQLFGKKLTNPHVQLSAYYFLPSSPLVQSPEIVINLKYYTKTPCSMKATSTPINQIFVVFAFGIGLAFFLGCSGGGQSKVGNNQTVVKPTSIDTVIYSGEYNGKNLFFENDYSKAAGSCIQGIDVNGKMTMGEVNASAFEIDFKNLNLKNGDKVVVKVVYKAGCAFKCLNEEVLHDGNSTK